MIRVTTLRLFRGKTGRNIPRLDDHDASATFGSLPSNHLKTLGPTIDAVMIAVLVKEIIDAVNTGLEVHFHTVSIAPTAAMLFSPIPLRFWQRQTGQRRTGWPRLALPP